MPRRTLPFPTLATLALALNLAGARAAAPPAPSPAADAPEVRIAVLAVHGEERALRDFEPTLAWLRRQWPAWRWRMQPLDAQALARAVQQAGVEFIITNPGYYVELEAEAGVTQLATLQSHGQAVPTDSVGSTVITRRQNGAPPQWAELRGRRLAIVAEDAFGGWRVAWREMQAAGVPATALGARIETGLPMQTVIEAVRGGRADAGVLRACLLEDEIRAGRVRPDEFEVVAERREPGFPCRLSSRLYPDWTLARLAGTPAALAKAVGASLLQMPVSEGRSWAAPQDQRAVHALFRELQIGPYEHLGQGTLRGLLRAHWQGLALAAAAALWWVFHVLRVETLVRRRTAELTQAIEGRESAERAARLHREQRDQFSRLGILGEMASNIAHELNQPLAAITNYAEGITRYIDAGRSDPALIRDGARGIAGQAERAGAIIQRIRRFVQRRELSREQLDVNSVLREALALFEGPAALHHIPLRLQLGSGLPPVMADPLELEQVLLNLLQNALDAMGGVDAARRAQGIVLCTRCGPEGIEVAVRDHGSGLSPEVQAHLFDTFFTTKPQGLGLGLSICRTIIESHGGRLWARNEAGGGLSMCFSLPPAPEETDTR